MESCHPRSADYLYNFDSHFVRRRICIIEGAPRTVTQIEQSDTALLITSKRVKSVKLTRRIDCARLCI